MTQTQTQKVHRSIWDEVSKDYVQLASLGDDESIVGVPRREGPNLPLYDTKSNPGERLTRHARTWILADELGVLVAVIVTERIAEDLERLVGKTVRLSRIGAPGRHQLDEL